VWKALTDPKLVALWWGRGNKLVIEQMVVERGGHWRFVEHSPHGVHGFEGRYREVKPIERVVRTFEWDGMPGHVAIETATLEDLGDGRTKLVSVSLFHTTQERERHAAIRHGKRRSAELRSARQSARVALSPGWLRSAPRRRRVQGACARQDHVRKNLRSNRSTQPLRHDSVDQERARPGLQRVQDALVCRHAFVETGQVASQLRPL